MIHKSSQDTAKQVESIKNLAKQQIEASIKQVELEIAKMELLATQAKQEWDGVSEINSDDFATAFGLKDSRMKSFHDNKPGRDYQLYRGFLKNLESIKKSLIDNKNILN